MNWEEWEWNLSGGSGVLLPAGSNLGMADGRIDQVQDEVRFTGRPAVRDGGRHAETTLSRTVGIEQPAWRRISDIDQRCPPMMQRAGESCSIWADPQNQIAGLSGARLANPFPPNIKISIRRVANLTGWARSDSSSLLQMR